MYYQFEMWKVIIIAVSAASGALILFVLISVFCTCIIHKCRKQTGKYSPLKDSLLEMHPSTLQIDESLFGVSFDDLQDLDEISSGAAGGVIFRATLFGETVVLKLFPVQYLDDSKNYELFKHELKFLTYVM